MVYVQVPDSNVWIPQATPLHGHPQKTQNYAAIRELPDGFETLDVVVGIPFLNTGQSVESRVEAALEHIHTAINQGIGLNPSERRMMVRSALSFEDRPESRAAGIGYSRIVQHRDDLPEILHQLLKTEANNDLAAYTEKKGIDKYDIGLQVCNLVRSEKRVNVAYSGAVRHITSDLIEVTVNRNFAFTEQGTSKIPDYRFIYEHTPDGWTLKYTRTDMSRSKSLCTPAEATTLASTVLEFFKHQLPKNPFPEGMEYEFVQREKGSPITIVQHAPVAFMPEPELSSMRYTRSNWRRRRQSYVIGCSEEYFPPEKILHLCGAWNLRELEEFNKQNQDGYLIVDSAAVIGKRRVPYSMLHNASTILETNCHFNDLSNHTIGLSRELGISIASPNFWLPRSIYAPFNHGLTVQIDERNQSCKVFYGNWQKDKNLPACVLVKRMLFG